MRGWDLARAIGVGYAISDDLCRHLISQATRLITDDKRSHGFNAAIEVAPDADPLARLLSFTGRTS